MNHYPKQQVVFPPYTVYFVAAVRLKDDRHMVCTEHFFVSGRNPLNRDEVIRRFRQMQTDQWSVEQYGTEDSWQLQSHTLAVRSFWIGD